MTIVNMSLQHQIMQKLERIEYEIEEIKEHMVDVDTILTEEEKKMLDESVKDEEEGKLVSLEKIEDVRNKTR